MSSSSQGSLKMWVASEEPPAPSDADIITLLAVTRPKLCLTMVSPLGARGKSLWKSWEGGYKIT